VEGDIRENKEISESLREKCNHFSHSRAQNIVIQRERRATKKEVAKANAKALEEKEKLL
jgi:thermostable 8-oxoguanine DNA glycosylase